MNTDKLDKHDRNLLAKLTSTNYVFPKTSAQEQRMYAMFEAGFLDRKWLIRCTRSGMIEFAWAYKLSDEYCKNDKTGKI